MNTQHSILEQQATFNSGVRVEQIARLVGRGTVCFAALITFSLGMFSVGAVAATYYVDSISGSDANPGSTQAAPWKSVPGMTGASAWGAISAGNKVPAGSVIEIKAGATFTGKRWLVDATYYQTGTASSPTTIRVSPSWGSGNVVIDGSGASVPLYNGGVQVTDINYMIISGADATRRIEIKNYSAHAGILHYKSGDGSIRAVGNQLQWFECHHSANYCVSNAWQDALLYEDGLAHDNGALEGGGIPASGVGIIMGEAADATGNNNILRRVKSYDNGKGASQNDGSVSFGFQITGGVNTLFDRCEAYGNGRDGFDGGRADNAGNASMVFLNSYSHDNGEDGFGLNAGPTGNVTAIHINTVAARNGQANWTIYDGAHIEIYNSVGRASSANIHAFMVNTPATTVKIRNSYMGVQSGGKQIHYYNPGLYGYPVFDSDYNLWVPNASNAEIFDDDQLTTYTAPITNGWTRGANDKYGLSFAQAFTNVAGDDYHLANATGPANNAGIYLTSPAGVNIDRSGVTRANPPDIGIYEFGVTGVPLALLAVQSRKTHGSAGSFDLAIDTQPVNGLVTVEPRVIGTGHNIIFQFNGLVGSLGSVSVAPVGTASATFLGSEVTVAVTNVPDMQRVTITLVNVNGTPAPFPITMGFLIGDVNNSRSVNSSDISSVKARSGQLTTGANFLFDLNTTGGINSSDISTVKARSGLTLP